MPSDTHIIPWNTKETLGTLKKIHFNTGFRSSDKKNENTESKIFFTLRKLHQMCVQTAWDNWLWKFLKKKSKKANS